VLDQSALALTIGMAGAIILLLVGTQILDWYWVVLLAVASFGVAVYRLRKTVPSTYKIAQRIDRKLALADALSTAAYFSESSAQSSGPSSKLAAHVDQAICERQMRDAESIARTVDVRVGVPFAAPRFAIPAIALAAVAVGLFVVRYAVTGSLSLQPSLVKMAYDTFFPYKPEVAKNRRVNDPRKMSQPDAGDPDSQTTENQDTPETALDAQDSPEEVTADSVDNSKSASKQGSQSDSPDQQAQNGDKSDKSTPGNDPGEDNSSKDESKSGKPQNGKDAKEAKQGNSNADNSSLMDKLRDAMANVMNKMTSSPKDGQQPSQSAQNGQQGPRDKSNTKGKPSQNKSDPSSDAQSDQSSDGADKSQSADAHGQEKGADKNASNDSKSGIGSADGDKSGKEADELKAMGKISEILGKRSANVSGEVMVEVGSSKQQLKTPWAQKQATHTEAGSEIHRDEVPLIYQPFVEQYFEEIRKSAPAAKTPAAKPADKNQNPG
jgi:hypothetical protein